MAELSLRAWLVIVLAGVGTYAIRLVFLAFADRLAAVPPGLARVLAMIPPAVLAAVVASSLVHRGGAFTPAWTELAAAALAAGVAWRTRSILLTLLVGMAALAGLELLAGG